MEAKTNNPRDLKGGVVGNLKETIIEKIIITQTNIKTELLKKVQNESVHFPEVIIS